MLNYDRLRVYVQRHPPWVLKPRSEAASMGIKKITAADELWPLLDALGDRQSFYVLEQYLPGDIYHVDSIVSERQPVFAYTTSTGTRRWMRLEGSLRHVRFRAIRRMPGVGFDQPRSDRQAGSRAGCNSR